MPRPTTPHDIGRRDFARIAVGTLGAATLAGPAAATAPTMAPKVAPGIKLCVQSSATPSDEQLLFLKQLGAGYVSVGSTPELRTAEGFMQIVKRYADVAGEIRRGLAAFAAEVRSGAYPADEHVYKIAGDELRAFEEELERDANRPAPPTEDAS